MQEVLGVLAGVASNGLGGTAVAVTRYSAGAIDPLTLGAFRFGIGVALLLPIALLQRARWPTRTDWLGVLGLGLLFFGLFPILFNAALIFTTAARGALAVSTIPLLSLIAGAVLGIEALIARKLAGAVIALAGVAFALMSGLALGPKGRMEG